MMGKKVKPKENETEHPWVLSIRNELVQKRGIA